MATTRINAVTATATTFAGDDFLPIDGNVYATRRILVTSLFASPSAIGSITPAVGTFTILSDTIGDVRIVPQNSQSVFRLRVHCSPLARFALQRLVPGIEFFTRFLLLKSSLLNVRRS